MKHIFVSIIILLSLNKGLFSASMTNANTITSDAATYFLSTDSAYLYRAKIDAFTYHFSGLLAIKKLDNNDYRCVMTTETGFTLIDLSMKASKAKVEFVIKEMNNPLFLRMIKNDLLLLLQLKPKIQATSFVQNDSAINHKIKVAKGISYLFQLNQLVEIIKESKSKTVVDIQFQDLNKNEKANTISIIHKNIPVTVTLSAFYNMPVAE